jgi:amino acid permease
MAGNLASRFIPAATGFVFGCGLYVLKLMLNLELELTLYQIHLVQHQESVPNKRNCARSTVVHNCTVVMASDIQK